jgi:hypothetical protein
MFACNIRTWHVRARNARSFAIIWWLDGNIDIDRAAPLPRAALILDEPNPSGGGPTTLSAATGGFVLDNVDRDPCSHVPVCRVVQNEPFNASRRITEVMAD